MIKLTETIVKRPVAAIMIILAVIVFGVMALFSMPQELTPEMEMPMLVVATMYPGAGPEDVEKLVTKQVEEAVGSLNGVRNIISQSSENVSLIILQYEYGIDIRRAYSDVKTRLDGIANRLPDESRTPMVIEMDINAQPTMTLSVSSGTKENLLYYVEDEIIPQLDRLSSVSSVDISGGRENYVRVEVKEEMMNVHGVTVSSVIASLSNVDYSAPLGTAEFGGFDLSVRTQVRYETINALNNIPLTLRSGDVIRLSDVAVIYMDTMDESSISRFNGNENISLSIHKPQSISAGRTSSDVTRAINALTANDPDISIFVVHDDSDDISSAVRSIGQTLILAIFLSMLVLFVFLGDIRACLIVGSSMPISLLVTFFLMDLMGYTLNIVSMSGLVIGVGMMVDNAIVVIDSCFKSMKSGKRDFTESAVAGTKFVMLSIFAVTLTTVMVFLPLAAIRGMSGQMFAPLGFSIIFALSASLFSAITLVPLFFVQFKPVERENAPAAKFLRKVENIYARFLLIILARKKTVVVITATIMLLSFFLFRFLNFELIPSTDEGIVRVRVQTRPGLMLEHVDEIMTELEGIVAVHPDVERYTLSSGGGGMFGSGGTSVTAYLKDKRNMQTNEVIEQWRHETRHILDCDIDITAGSSQGMMMGSSGIEVLLEGDDLDSIREASEQVEALMNAHPDIIRVSTSIDRANPQAEIVIDPLLAASKNLVPQMVTSGVFTALNGSETSKIRIDGHHYPIRVEYPRGRYQNVSDVSNMMITSATGMQVPLADISTIKFTDTPQTISRQNNRYTVTITGVPTEAARFTAQEEIMSDVETLFFPRGVTIGTASMMEMQNEELAALGRAIITAIFLVFMLLTIQFESIRHSLMVMLCVPLAVIGSLLLMVLTGTTISMVSMLGFLVMIGLVVNNGILFVDTTNRYREDRTLHEALIHAGRSRLRPILMITLTSVLAMLPLALGIGDNEMMKGLGVTVIGGLTASTVLALLLLPTFYLILDGNPEKRAERKRLRQERRDKKIGNI